MAGQAVYATTKWGLRGWSLSCYEVSALLHHHFMHASKDCGSAGTSSEVFPTRSILGHFVSTQLL